MAAPANAAVVIATANASRAAARWRTTPLGSAARRSDLAALVDLAAECPGPAVMWITEDGSVSVIADAGREAEALAARLGAGAWSRWAGAEVRPATLAGAPAALVERDGVDLGGWARSGTRIVAASTRPALERAVGMATAAPAGGGPQQAPDGADLTMTVDLDRLPRPHPGRFDLLARVAPRPLDALGSGGTVTAKLRFDPGTTTADATLTVRSATGVASLLASLRGTAPRPALIPAEATSFGAARFERGPAITAAGQILAASSPLLWIGLQGANALAAQTDGSTTDPATRFLGTLTGSAAWVEAHGRPPLLALGVESPAQAADAADAVLGPLTRDTPRDAVTAPGVARLVVLPVAGEGTPPALAWAVRGGWAVAAFGAGEEVARGLPSSDVDAAGAWTDPSLASTLALAPRDASALAIERLGAASPGPLGRLLAFASGEGRAVAVAWARPGGPGRIDIALRVTTASQ